MQIFTPHKFTELEWAKIDEGSSLTLNDRFKFDSHTFRTLLSDLGTDFSPSELQEVYRVELLNVRKLINAAHLILIDSSALSQLKLTAAYKKLAITANNSSSDLRLKKRAEFTLLMTFLLSDTMGNNLKTKFDGKIPPKTFSFRQDKAEKWFSDYCGFIITIGSRIFWKSDSNQAFAYFLANTSYYLNKSQPFKYYSKPGESQNNAISRILREILTDDKTSATNSIINNLNSIPFFKDI